MPSANIISNIKQKIFLSWAKDDGLFDKFMNHNNAGHPYFGPHGAKYFNNLTNCELQSWNEIDEISPRIFFETKFFEKASEFL